MQMWMNQYKVHTGHADPVNGRFPHYNSFPELESKQPTLEFPVSPEFCHIFAVYLTSFLYHITPLRLWVGYY